MINPPRFRWAFWFRWAWGPLLLLLVLAVALPSVTSRMEPGREDSTVRGWLVFGKGGMSERSSDFTAGEVTAILGGYSIDLSKAAMKTGEAVVHANALVGHVSIRVPKNWSVRLEGVPILGGYRDLTAHPAGAAAEQLTIHGLAILGAVRITN